MLVIWGRGNSINVQKVLWCCEEMGVPYERIDAGGRHGVVDTPHYRGLNPNGLVPTIDDDGFVLWESNAIIRYLAAKHGPGSLWPQTLTMRAEADKWMDWFNTMFYPALRPLFLGLVRTPAAERDSAAIEGARVRTGAALAILDATLAHHTFVAGESFTMGDIVLGCGIWRWYALPIERPSRPHVQRWFELLARRPAYEKIVMQPLT